MFKVDRNCIQLVEDAIQKGAVGVDMGRNIWQSEYPVPMIKAIRAVVHENANAKEALEVFNSAKK